LRHKLSFFLFLFSLLFSLSGFFIRFCLLCRSLAAAEPIFKSGVGYSANLFLNGVRVTAQEGKPYILETPQRQDNGNTSPQEIEEVHYKEDIGEYGDVNC
jgi:hypothetical protein